MEESIWNMWFPIGNHFGNFIKLDLNQKIYQVLGARRTIPEILDTDGDKIIFKMTQVAVKVFWAISSNMEKGLSEKISWIHPHLEIEWTLD